MPVLRLLMLLMFLASPAWAQTKPATKPYRIDTYEVGYIVGEFARDYAAVSEAFEFEGDFRIVGRVISTEVKTVDKNTWVTIQLAPRAGRVLIPVYVSMQTKLADDVRALNPDDLISIDAIYVSRGPPPPILREIKGFHGSAFRLLDDPIKKMRQDFLGFIEKNNKLKVAAGKENPLLVDAAKHYDTAAADNGNLTFIIGEAIMKSGKATMLAVHNGKLFNFELTPEQAKAAGFSRTGSRAQISPGSSFISSRVAEIAAPELTTPGVWDTNKPISGKYKITQLVDLNDLPAEYGLRMTVYVHKNVSHFTHMYSGKPGSNPREFTFTMNEKNAAALKLSAEPTPRLVFFEVIRRTANGRGVPIEEVVSDPVALLLMMSW